MSDNEKYIVRKSLTAPQLVPSLADPVWRKADVVELKWVAAESQGKIPQVCCRLLHDDNTIYGLFQIKDASRRACHTEYNSSVCCDSCVEFFFEPKPSTEKGYFNFEISGNGQHLNYYIRDWTRTDDGFVDFDKMAPEDGLKLQAFSSLPAIVEPEEFGEKEWFVMFTVPVAVLEKYHGPIGKLGGQVWRGNFYKCGDELKEPHWIGWRGVAPLNFHLPPFFGELCFE